MQRIRSVKDKKRDLSKALRIVLVFATIFFILLPYIYIVSEKDHECHEESCLICENIAHCYDLINSTGKTIVFVYAVVLALCFGDHVYCRIMKRSEVLFISRPRIRMNN